MKTYLAVPLYNNRNKELASFLYKIIKELGHDVISEWVTWDNPNLNLDPYEICKRDFDAIQISDMLIAEVSYPSIGVGMEIMYAYSMEKPIVCLYSSISLSNLIQGLPRTILVKYSTLHDLRTKLSSKIDPTSTKTLTTRSHKRKIID